MLFLYDFFLHVVWLYTGVSGYGLGLALAKRIVEAMQTEIEIKSPYRENGGSGSLFHFTTGPIIAAPTSSSEEVAIATAGGAAGGGVITRSLPQTQGLRRRQAKGRAAEQPSAVQETSTGKQVTEASPFQIGRRMLVVDDDEVRVDSNI